MISMEIVFQQILVIFGYVLVGYVSGKVGLINREQQRFLSKLISSLILPFTVLAASSMETRSEDLLNLGISTVIMTTSFILTTVCCQLYAKAKGLNEAQSAAYTGLCTYPNNAFVGMPLCIALLGEWGTLYGAASMIAFNLPFFTYQVSLFTKKKFSIRSLMTPLNFSTILLILMLVFHLRFPSPVQTVVSNIGGITTPLALIIVVVMLAGSNLSEVFREKRAYIITLIRNLVCPLAVLVVLALLPLDPTMRLAVLIFVACPVGNMTSVFAIQTDMEPQLCARATLLSTLFFAGTIPFIICLGQMVF